MARKKQEPKPLSHLRFDFIDSLENVCQQSIMLLRSVKTVLDHGGESVPAPIRDILQERHDALQRALIGER